MWYRPSYFPQQGETTWRQSCDREVDMVRNAVGVVDVSTLGKIDIQGPDAAQFLICLYKYVLDAESGQGALWAYAARRRACAG